MDKMRLPLLKIDPESLEKLTERGGKDAMNIDILPEEERSSVSTKDHINDIESKIDRIKDDVMDNNEEERRLNSLWAECSQKIKELELLLESKKGASSATIENKIAILKNNLEQLDLALEKIKKIYDMLYDIQDRLELELSNMQEKAHTIEIPDSRN